MLRRRLKQIGLAIAARSGVLRLTDRLSQRAVRILCYHSAWLGPDDFPGDTMFIRPETFAARMQWLVDRKYPVVSLDAAVRGLRGETSLPPRATVITIDDGWFATYSVMRPVLVRLGLPATLYVDTASLLRGGPVPHVMARYFVQIASNDRLSDKTDTLFARATNLMLDFSSRLEAALKLGRQLGLEVDQYIRRRSFAYMTATELREFAASPGLSVELHTHRHTLGDHSPELVRRETTDNREALGALLGRDPETFTHFCYPSGVFALGDGVVFEELGIRSATSTQRDLVDGEGNLLLIPRLLDGDDVSAAEFASQMQGLPHIVRKLLGRRTVGYDRPYS